MRTLDRHNREKIDARPHLGDLDDRGEAGEAATDDNDFRSCHSYSTGFPSVALCFDRAAGLARIAVVPGSGVCSGRERNDARLARPATLRTKNKPRQIANNRFRAFSPEMMPHFAENSQ